MVRISAHIRNLQQAVLSFWPSIDETSCGSNTINHFALHLVASIKAPNLRNLCIIIKVKVV